MDPLVLHTYHTVHVPQLTGWFLVGVTLKVGLQNGLKCREFSDLAGQLRKGMICMRKSIEDDMEIFMGEVDKWDVEVGISGIVCESPKM